MNERIVKWVFQGILTVTLFSLWAGFALLIVNKYFLKDLPGYTIGRFCIWEVIALIVAAVVARTMIGKWGNVEFDKQNVEPKLRLNYRFGIYFLIYFLIAIAVGLWQFWLFSLKY